jgi:signal transduction histidine kinase
VQADPDRLAQVVTNLLSNAVKISPPNGAVEVAVERHDDLIRISVRDHGPGIPALFKAHVFENFAQADATDARNKGGIGLGLSIVKEIVAQFGGAVGFDDAHGGDTVFHLDLACG